MINAKRSMTVTELWKPLCRSSRTWDSRHVTFLHRPPFFSAHHRGCWPPMSLQQGRAAHPRRVKSALLTCTEKHNLVGHVDQQCLNVDPDAAFSTAQYGSQTSKAPPFQNLLSTKTRWVPCVAVCNRGTALQSVEINPSRR